MSCISTNLPYFKELQKSLNVSAPLLKQILHKLQRDRGNLDVTPQEIYLWLQGKSLEFGENSFKLYEQRYKDPIIVSKEEYKAALAKAKSIFPAEAVMSYQTADGNYVIRVAEPTNSILKNAKRDAEGRLLADNGKVSNLNERQYVQVRTLQFKRWFGDWQKSPDTASKVVDENGEPLVVYHGSRDNSFTIFDSTKNDKGQKGFFFTNDRTMASSYGKNPREFFINSRNPYIIEGHNNNWNDLIVGVTNIAKDKLDSIRLFRNDLLLQLKEGKTSKEIYDFWDNKYFKLYDKYLSLSNSFIDKIKKIAILNRLNKFEGRGNFLKSTRYTERVLELDSEDTNIIFKSITDYGPVFNKEAAVNMINNVAANVYVVTKPNNIKSAIDNTGDFSTTNDNIYLNKTGDILKIIQSIPWIEQVRREDITHRTLYKEHGKMYITLGEFYRNETDLERVINSIKIHLIRNGISPNSLNFNIKRESNRIEVTPNDTIQKSNIRLLSAKSIETTLAFLETKIPGLSHKVIRESSLRKMGIEDNARAFFKDGVVYLVEGRFNEDIAIEECLHPLVNAIKKQNPKLFSQLYNTATELFPALHEEIKQSYDEKSVEPELVTQALSRNVREELKNSEDRSKWKNLVNKFYNYIKNLFGEIQIGNIKPSTTFKELAQIINSEDGVFNVDMSGLEYHPETQTEQENQSQETTQKQDKMLEQIYTINRQFNGILESKALTSTDLAEVSDVIADMISSKIDEMEAKRDQVKEILVQRNPNDNTDINKLSRFELIKALGIQHFIDLVKQDFVRNKRTAIAENRVKITEVVKNWDYFINRIKSTISKMEGIHLEIDAEGERTVVVDEVLTDQYEEDGSNVQDQVEDGQLSWQVENNTIDPITSITQLVKLQLRGLFQLKDNGRRDEEGNTLYDHIRTKWGTDAKVGYDKAAKCLLKWLNEKQTLKEMVKVLQEKSKRNPWVTQLLPKLMDTTGKYTTEQSQFFSTFYRPFMKFTNVGTKGGKLTSRQLNEHPFLTLTIKTIEAAYKLGQHPLVSNGLASGARALNAHYTKLQELVNDFEANKDEIFMELRAVTKGLGFEINVAEIQLEQEEVTELMHQLKVINTMISKNANNAEYDPFAYGRNKDGIRSNLMRFFERLTDQYEDEAVTSFYEGGKMRQSYLLPSFLTMFTNKFKLEGAALNRFLADEFDSEFMRDSLLGDLSDEELNQAVRKGWNNVWLQDMMTDPKKRRNFGCKTSITFNGSTYMKGMTKEEYALAMITEFYGENSKETDSLFLANFRVPIESNKPSAEYITFYARGGAFYKEDLVGNFLKVFNQEICRIKTVLLREKSREESLKRLKERYENGDITAQQYESLVYSINQEAITNLEEGTERGKKFIYLDFLNKELEKGTELGKLIEKTTRGEKVDTAELSKKAAEAIRTAIQERVDRMIETFKQNGVFKLCKTIKKIGNSNEAVQNKLELILWNDAFASTQIMQLLITDPAFLRDTDDVQKRFAQVHASGSRANVAAVDFDGNEVSDGIHRSITLKDVKGFTSNIIENLTIVLNKKIANSKSDSESVAWEAFKDKLVGEKGLYRTGINLTDAQAYSCPTSYRKKALMFGLWSKEAEATYKRIKDGIYTYSDVVSVFQPFKPFVYGNSIESTGVNAEGAMTKMRVPVQNKNAECLLVLADAILAGEETGKPNLLRALFQVMEDSHYDTVMNEDGSITRTYKTDGIDTVNFESAIKSGAQGRIDTQAYAEGREITITDKEGNQQQRIITPEAAFKSQLKSLIYKTEIVNGKEITTYNRTSVKHLSFENYCMQQPVPEHFLDHSQLEGSQQRALIPSDLATVDANGETIYYEVGKDKVKMTAEELRERYDRLHAENIQKGIEEIEDLFMLKESTPQQRKEALSKLLVDQFLRDGRYSGDMLYMVTLNKETGDFPVSLEDPSIRTQVEQAINSIIKKRVNKLKMKGGPLVQMSNFGMSKELKIKFLDKEGNPLKDRSAFDSDEAYKEYVTKNQGGISHFEVIAPAYTEAIFKEFMDKEGNISVEALEMLNPDLLKMIGYRIPTEAKYSIAPLKIVGFAPREMGDVIILPAEITLITGSDFDIDKEYCIRKTIDIKPKYPKISAEKRGSKFAEVIMPEKTNASRRETVRMFADEFVNNPYNRKYWTSPTGGRLSDAEYTSFLKSYLDTFYVLDPATGVDANNNEIFDMSYAVLTSESNVARALKPGGFEEHKHIAYAIAAYRIPEVREKYPNFNTLLKMDTKEIGKLIERSDKNLIFLDTQLEYYDHNNSASSLLGISAVNSAAHAILVDDNIGIDLTGISVPTIAGFQLGNQRTASINIFAGTGENSHLSNFAIRPFTLHGNTFNTVEAAFQAAKLEALKRYINAYKTDDPVKIKEVGKVIKFLDELKMKAERAKTGVEARRIGRTKITSDNPTVQEWIDTSFQHWDNNSSRIMSMLIKESFTQNPVALHQLLETGNATLTHIQDRGKWKTEFPRILMEIRDSFKGTDSLIDLSSNIIRLDPSTTADGASIAETLGSCVAAAADAAKDPVLNFMNLNPQTFNVYTTLIRLGVPNSVATLLMSSKVLANAITFSNAKTLAGEWSTPESVLREQLSPETLEKIGYLPSSAIFSEEITRDELIRGLYEDDGNIDLKIANALVALFDISKKVRLADQVTRLNSISSAVGPTTLDNYIFQSNLETLDNESSLVDMSTGEAIGMRELLDKHQMLSQFSRAYDLANSILINDMPQTRAFIESIQGIYATPTNVAGLDVKLGLPAIVKNDRALMNRLREFFTSWVAVKNGLVNYKELEFLSKEFPKTIASKKAEHSDNYLVQNLYLNIDNMSGFPIIAMNISKIEKSSRDMLTASWADLYAKDREFALNLFKYSFFRGGLGFSPKTFMNVLPIQMKIDMEGYLQLFKNTETLTPQEANLMYKQFVSNNYINNKLAPIRKISPGKDGRIIIEKKYRRADSFRNVRFFKTKNGDSYKLYECVGGFEEGPVYRIYKEIPLLGAEGNFIELSTENIETSLFDVKFDQEGDGSMPLTPDVNDIPADRQRTIVEARKILNDVLDQNQQQRTREMASQLEEEAKSTFIQRVSTRLSTILEQRGYTPVKQSTFDEMLKQLDLC